MTDKAHKSAKSEYNNFSFNYQPLPPLPTCCIFWLPAITITSKMLHGCYTWTSFLHCYSEVHQLHQMIRTRSSAITEGPRDTLS